MKIIQISIFAVLKRFPGHKDIIKRLFSENNNFKTVCEDFQQCSEALRYWNQSTEPDAPSRRKEYAVLLLDLEREIKRHLTEVE